MRSVRCNARVGVDGLVLRGHEVGAMDEVESDIRQIDARVLGGVLVEIEGAEREIERSLPSVLSRSSCVVLLVIQNLQQLLARERRAVGVFCE